MHLIDIIGCNGDTIAAAGLAALQQAEIVAGSRTLLAACPVPEVAEKVELDGNLLGVLPDLIARSKIRRTAILASGDPLYCGIGATLLRFVPAKRLRFFPGLTAFQMLFARLGQPWEGVELCSLHARRHELPHRRLLRAPMAAIYGDGGRPAQQLARELIQAFPAAAKRPAAAGCNLGFPDEQILRGTLADIARDSGAAAALSVLALLPDPAAAYPPLPLGLADEHYCHFKNMITHPEVRAVALAKLRLIPGVLWDLGAGSGSVGLEAAGLCPGLTVHAVEKHPERLEHLAQNLAREGLANMSIHAGDAEAMLDDLPAPDRIFIGGGGRELLESSFARLRPGGLLVMTGVMVETVALMSTALAGYRRELLWLNVSRARVIASGEPMFHAENPIAIAVYGKPEGRKR